jgi:hypothetical protein
MYKTEMGFGRHYKYAVLVLCDHDVHATTVFVKPLHTDDVINGAGDTDTLEAPGLFPVCICIGFADVVFITLIL